MQNHRVPYADDSIGNLIDRSELNKKLLRKVSDITPKYKGMSGRTYEGIIDAYHGETGLPLARDAEQALQRAWNEIIDKTFPAEYSDYELYDKSQPLILRQLASNKLFSNLSNPVPQVPGINVKPDEVVVCPYSSMELIEKALATIARPSGIIVCPEGFYKSFGLVARKYGLSIISSRNKDDGSFKIDAVEFKKCLAATKASGDLCLVLLTYPGNPVVSEYSLEELLEIGNVLAEIDVPVICDMAFDQMVDTYIPLASLQIATAKGTVRLFDRILSVTGNSKGYNAFGPCKFGAATTGNQAWLKQIRKRLLVPFQRETTHLVRAVIEHTPESYFEQNRKLMRRQYREVDAHIMRINKRFGSETLRPLGSPQGIFLGVIFDSALCRAAKIHMSSELEGALLRLAGIDSVSLDRTGSKRLGVRLNIFAPRKEIGQEKPELLDELFDRIGYFIEHLQKT